MKNWRLWGCLLILCFALAGWCAAEAAYCLPVMAQARQAGVRCEIYPDSAKMKKQMSYANAKAVPFVAIVGENEMNEGKVTMKNMATGEQLLLTPDEMINIIKK